MSPSRRLPNSFISRWDFLLLRQYGHPADTLRTPLPTRGLLLLRLAPDSSSSSRTFPCMRSEKPPCSPSFSYDHTTTRSSRLTQKVSSESSPSLREKFSVSEDSGCVCSFFTLNPCVREHRTPLCLSDEAPVLLRSFPVASRRLSGRLSSELTKKEKRQIKTNQGQS